MAQHRKILVTLPDSLLDELDGYAEEERISRSEFMRQAATWYLKEKKKERLCELLKKGYLEMAGLNAAMAEEGVLADSEALAAYEEKLSECE